MFTVLINVKIKKDKMSEIMEMSKNMWSHHEYPPGLMEVTVLVNHSEGKIVKIVSWESEDDFNRFMGSEEMKGRMKAMGDFLEEPPTMDHFDTAMRLAPFGVTAGVM